jgi:glucosamine--fructose-6-phosphate aminotransferase (isomerizing)
MCGVFGILGLPDSSHGMSKLFQDLMTTSESRGKDASGVLIASNSVIEILKSQQRGKHLLAEKTTKRAIRALDKVSSSGEIRLLAGHTRMMTHGDISDQGNNQPAMAGERFIILHNGIITNWQTLANDVKIPDPHKFSDTRIFSLLLETKCKSLVEVREEVDRIVMLTEGANNFIILDKQKSELYFYTSNGSLFYGLDKKKNFFFFASEKKIIHTLLRKRDKFSISQIPKRKLFVVSDFFSPELATKFKNSILEGKFLKTNDIVKTTLADMPIEISQNEVTLSELNQLINSVSKLKIEKLMRCKKCILPITFPGIKFDVNGICSLCRTSLRDMNKEQRDIQYFIKKCGDKVLVPLSGGRDSSFALHYIVKELNISAIAYTYDWGLISNVARENISRLCGTLGVEHILIAADIRRKRENVKSNLLAWLEKPNIGMIPILMAGDKQFLTLAEKVRRENNLAISVFAMNSYERTLFKSAYAGAPFNEDSKRSHGITRLGQLRMLKYYGSKMLANHKYWNKSLFDSLTGFFSFYFVKPNYIQLFDFIDWNEDEIMNVLSRDYGWETDSTAQNSWRMGDATSGFYNYLYLKFGGFTENDTFRSNQIRSGAISRSVALRKIEQENKIQQEMIVEYLKVIDVDLSLVNQKLVNWGHFRAT